MFTAKVYRIMVGSLSGAMEEVYVAKETIRKWNQQNAERTGKVFMPIEWGTSQETIQNSDLVVGIVDNWIDNTEFVEDCVEAGKQVMLLFNSLQDPTNTISSEYRAVLELNSQMNDQCFCTAFKGNADVVNILCERFDSIK